MIILVPHYIIPFSTVHTRDDKLLDKNLMACAQNKLLIDNYTITAIDMPSCINMCSSVIKDIIRVFFLTVDK